MKNLLPAFLIFLIWTFIPLSFLLPQEIYFKEHVVENNFNGPAGIFVIDIDKNGSKDIICAGYDGNTVSLWLNNGDNPATWSQEIVDNNFLGAIYVVAADVNQDSLIDIIGAGWYASQVVLWKNLGGQNPIQWEKIVIDNNSLNAHEVFVCDFDEDNDIDILAASAYDNCLTLYRNGGSNPISWSKEIITSDFSGARSVCVGDIDNDNDNDVVGAALAGNEIAWWKNEGGSPIAWTKYSITNDFIKAHKVCLYDMDNDLDLDILGTAISLNQIAWWRNDGGNPIEWTKIIVTSSFSSAFVSYPADLDLDGNTDVVGTAWGDDQVAWWKNGGSDTTIWAKAIIKSSFNGAWPLFLADIDNDFDTDIISGAQYADNIVWWENSYYMADFTGDAISGNIPLEVHFTDNSNLKSTIVSWEWDFDYDGVVDSYEQNPIFIYNEEGTYSVYLKVSDGQSEDVEIKKAYINVSITGIQENVLPKTIRLYQNYPNPFNPNTNIKYELQEGSNVKVRIYNLLGQEIVELVNEFQSSGIKTINWNGKDKNGCSVDSGVYLYTLISNDFSQTNKMLIIK